MGFRGAALMAILTSCVHEEDTYVDALTLTKDGQTAGGGTSTTVTTPASSTGSTSDILGVKNPLLTLTLANESALSRVGGYIQRNGITVGRISSTAFAAVTQTCSHEPKKQVILNGSTEFYCTAHGARFNLDGTAKNSLAGRGITAYKTLTDGKTLVVYS